MKNSLIFAILLLNIGCAVNVQPGYPDCLEDRIKDFKKNSICDRGANVTSYLFQGDTVFVFSPGTCGADISSTVYDKSCKRIGYLGGFIGNRIINGENFTNAEFLEIVWSD